MFVAHVDGELVGSGFRVAVLVEAELIRRAVFGGVQRIGVCAVARIKRQGAVCSFDRMNPFAHAGSVVIARMERGIAVAGGGAHAEFERVIGIRVSALERTGDGEVFRDFIIIFVVAGIADYRVGSRRQFQGRPIVGAHDVDRDVHGSLAAVPVVHGDGEAFLLGLALLEGLRFSFVDRVGIGSVLLQGNGTVLGFQRNAAVAVGRRIADLSA